MRKLLIVCGPTATGKTSLAIKLAKKFGGQLVNVDSRQVYRGMNIGTGKDLPQNSSFNKIKNSKLGIKNESYKVGYYLISGVPIWLLDVVEPDYRFNVVDYLGVTIPVIERIWQQKQLPILVGGTGFYIKILMEGVGTAGIIPDWSLRKKLGPLTIGKLQKKIKQIDPSRFNRMNYSDRQNPRRLIRAIEVAEFKKKTPAQFQFLNLKNKDVFWIGLKMSPEKIRKKINYRVTKRLKQGLIKEIEGLLVKYGFNNSVLGETIAYRQWQEYFAIPKSERKEILIKVIDRWKSAEYQYAQRQITWFKKNKQINWFEADRKDLFSIVAKTVGRWYIKDND
ncbi:MAG: tRNA (adenosine(37)-N6)-dimethylallyltransferase MiaA [Candidatus Shapirobacteria bacterium]|nr:tRNA (adenosine(37)-N6)-dimethylallyltransferase MiaA [Candidatus Shapirobacteria bacterium]